MGNFLSGSLTRESVTSSNNNLSETKTMEGILNSDVKRIEDSQNTDSDEDTRARRKEDEMKEFRKQLIIKREQRKEILSRHRAEKIKLEKAVQNEIRSKLELVERNKQLRDLLTKNNIDIPDDLQPTTENSEVAKAIQEIKDEAENLKSMNIKLRCELASTNNTLQAAYSDIADLSAINTESIKQITSLKEVITVSKTMINLREEQLNQLKNKLNEIEKSLADRETNILSADLRQEYERQLQNIRTLRGLYEERARLAEVSRQALTRELQEQKEVNQVEVKKNQDLTAKIEELEAEVNTLENELDEKNNTISLSQKETQDLKAEMEVVNKLFSQVLLGYKNKKDLDTLLNRLEENHGLLTQMAERENGSEVSSALPKLLLQLVSQVEESEHRTKTQSEQSNEEEVTNNDDDRKEDEADIQTSGNTTAKEIVQNLPKVWRVLTELLSHQSVPDPNDEAKVSTCYKSVETKSGPVLIPSVSQTYIRLKDLIIEKLTLNKEVNRMKQLNTHLETRLQEQERRLCLVTSELSKTWHVVGRLRRHHHQLHTHEKILKYELQQKRKLLNEIKEELEYCREKWEQAREKNNQSEKDWKNLREEFSSRKLNSTSMSLNTSAESGYSDERPSDDSSESNDECEYVKETQIRCKKKLKKSFETVADSSNDFNLAVERDDPASDMLDVADLPLDNQDPEVIVTLDISKSEPKSNSNSLVENEHKIELTHSVIFEPLVREESILCDNTNPSSHAYKTSNEINNSPELKFVEGDCPIEVSPEDKPIFDPKQILDSITDQNERLERKDKKLCNLEMDSESLLKKTQNISKISNVIDDTLNNLLNRPSSSKQIVQENGTCLPTDNNECYIESSSSAIENNDHSKERKVTSVTEQLDNTELSNQMLLLVESAYNGERKINNTPEDNNSENPSKSQEPAVDFKAILENVRRQNEHLALKDERLQKLENGCSSVIKNITNTISIGDEISTKLDTLHDKRTKDCYDAQAASTSSNVTKTETHFEDKTESTFSNDIDHEARFAARDERLKRLEEQTKSLVTKVNKTATKGVKINYKLEELHNIYASESSRAGTPSEENEENPQQSGSS